MGYIFAMKVVRPLVFLCLFVCVVLPFIVYGNLSNVERIRLDGCSRNDLNGIYYSY